MNKEAYQLTAEERQVLTNINQAVVQRKLAVYELNIQNERVQKEFHAQLDRAMKERDGAEQLFSGAFAMLANSHGLAGGELTTDFTRILPPGQTKL